jgi:lipoprotein-anchoring transpeptidase ErfK/SrfK
MKKLVLLFLLLILFSANQVSAVKAVDTDGDGLSDEIELKLGTDIQFIDTDGDGYKDGEEVVNGYNPLMGNNDQSLGRRVEVDLNTQQMKYYLNNILIGTAPVSTGKIGTETPTGKFAIIRKLPVYRYVGPGYDLPNTKWNLEFKRSFYLHGAYWHNQFGVRPMSHGCVNIGYKDAEKIYKFLKVGDSVKVTGKTPHRAITKK